MRICRSLSRLKPSFAEKVKAWLEENPEIFVTESRRSAKRQAWLFASGRTRPGPKLTWTLQSKHLSGEAVDVAFRGEELYPRDHARWVKIADSARKFGMDWSYALWGRERVHFQDVDLVEPVLPAWAKLVIERMEGLDIPTPPADKLEDFVEILDGLKKGI